MNNYICKRCEKGTLNPVVPGAVNTQCSWCWAVFTPLGELYHPRVQSLSRRISP